MKRILSPHKHGIVKINKAKERQKLKKAIRQIAEGETDESSPVSGSEFIFKKKIKLIDGDVTNKLLALVSKTETTANMRKIKDPSLINEGKIGNIPDHESNINISQNKLFSSKPPKRVKSSKTIEEIKMISQVQDNKNKPINKNNVKKSIKYFMEGTSENTETKNRILKNQEMELHTMKEEDHNSHGKQELIKQHHINPNVKSKKKRLLLDLQDAFVKKKSIELEVCKNAIMLNKKSLKVSKNDEHQNKQMRKSTKKSKSLGNTLSSGDRIQEVNDETVVVHSKNTDTSEICEFSPILVKNLCEQLSASGKKHKAQKNFRKEDKSRKTSVSKQNSKGEDVKTNVVNSLSQFSSKTNSQNEKESDKCVSSNLVLANSEQEKNHSGEWCVVNSDDQAKESCLLRSTKKFAKRKKKQSFKYESLPQITSHFLKEQQEQNYIEDVKENNSESMKENGIYSVVDDPSNISKTIPQLSNRKLRDDECKSAPAPILVQMSKNDVLPNPFRKRMSDSQMHRTSAINMRSDISWKPTSVICSTDKWKVQYGINKHLANLDNGDVESVDVNESGYEQREKEMVLSPDKYNEPSTNVSDNENSQPLMEDNPLSPYSLIDISENEAILALPPSSTMYFNGTLKVKVLVGKISVLGYEFSHRTSRDYTVYSPFGVSCLCLQACTESEIVLPEENYWNMVQEKMHSMKKTSKISDWILQNVPEFSSLILLSCVSETFISFLHKFYATLHFPSCTTKNNTGEAYSDTLRTLYLNPQGKDLFRPSAAWNVLTSSLWNHKSDGMRIMVCGGKGVGKSTLLRFLINQTLLKFKEVLYIDFDVGQSEFAVPGCVSAVVVKNPLLGPNFTHLTNPERMVYVGEIDVSRCSNHYVQCAEHIFDWCCSQPHLQKLPWFINTMGFVRGLGVDLTVGIIKMVNPTDLIQINSTVIKRNFPFLLNLQNVQKYVVSPHSLAGTNGITVNPFRFHLLPSMAETPDNKSNPWGMQANVARDTVLLAYLSQIAVPPNYSLLEVTPYRLPFSTLKLCVGHEKLEFCDYFSAMNANLVALCIAQNVDSLKPNNPEYPEILVNVPICHSFGFGIVRGVDLEKKMFFIITPVEAIKMKSVNCLVLGSVHLPECIYTSQDEALGSIPYVVEGALLPLARGIRAAKPVRKLN